MADRPARQPFLAELDLTRPIPQILAWNAELVARYGKTGYLQPGLVGNLIPDAEADTAETDTPVAHPS